MDKFEKNISKRMGSKHTVAVGNGTDALFLVLKALLWQVMRSLTTPFTFIAILASIATAGAKPVCRVKMIMYIDETKLRQL